MQTVSIKIGLDLYQKLQALKESPDMSIEEVIRLLILSNEIVIEMEEDDDEQTQQPIIRSSGTGWFIDGVLFPEETLFRAFYKRNEYRAVVNNGALSLDGKRFFSPSAAAGHITENSVNGWKFWECKRPGDEMWHAIDSLRKYR